jgi:hypothetical protein
MESWYVIEGVGGVVEVIDERGCVRHDWYEYCARAPVGRRGLIGYRFGNVSARGRRKTGIARTTGRMRTKGYAYGCDDGRRREDLAKFKASDFVTTSRRLCTAYLKSGQDPTHMCSRSYTHTRKRIESFLGLVPMPVPYFPFPSSHGSYARHCA